MESPRHAPNIPCDITFTSLSVSPPFSGISDAMDTTNPLDPRFGRCPSSSTTSSSAASHHHLPDTIPVSRVSNHRRAHSETFLRLPDDFLFDLDTDFSLADVEFPPLSDENGGNSGFKPVGTEEKAKGKGGAHLRSLSVDAALLEGLGLDEETVGGEGEAPEAGMGMGMGMTMDRKVRHKHNGSMDGSSSLFEPESMDFVKKAMAADKLAELALLDPKRAKRILANRQSAARSKERKVRHMSELERKVQTLQTEATTLSAQLTLLQRDTTDLTNENKELKLRLQAIEQQAHLRDALNQALRDEVQRLKIATAQIAANNGNTFNTQLQQQQQRPQYFPHHPQQLHGMSTTTTTQTLQQLHTNNQKNGGQPSVDDSMDFMPS